MIRYTVRHADPRRRVGVLTTGSAPQPPPEPVPAPPPAPESWSPAQLLVPGIARSASIVPSANDPRPLVSVIRGARR